MPIPTNPFAHQAEQGERAGKPSLRRGGKVIWPVEGEGEAGTAGYRGRGSKAIKVGIGLTQAGRAGIPRPEKRGKDVDGGEEEERGKGQMGLGGTEGGGERRGLELGLPHGEAGAAGFLIPGKGGKDVKWEEGEEGREGDTGRRVRVRGEVVGRNGGKRIVWRVGEGGADGGEGIDAEGEGRREGLPVRRGRGVDVGSEEAALVDLTEMMGSEEEGSVREVLKVVEGECCCCGGKL